MNNSLKLLSEASAYAKSHSMCTKVQVGCVIVAADGTKVFGANTADFECAIIGCLRVQKYGNADKTHRNPDDCRACHSEIEALSKAAQNGISTSQAVIYITRYPCEACARAIVRSGISTVVYGRQTKISEMTAGILRDLRVIHRKDWDEEDVTT